MAEFGRRTLKKAQTRLNILNAVYRLSNALNFNELKVTSIIAEVGITEMTFFNYFQKKEDILKYMMGIWAVDLTALQLKKPLKGEEAIRQLFAHTASHIKKHPRLIANFVASLLTSDLSPTAMEIEPPDRLLLYPDIPELCELKIPSGNEMIMAHLAEIDPHKDQSQTLVSLASSFYGDIVVAHTAGLDIDDLYTHSLDLIFKTTSQNSLPEKMSLSFYKPE